MARLSEQLRLLAERAASVEAHAEAARTEASEKRDLHVAVAQAQLRDQQKEFSDRVSGMGHDAKATWTGVENLFKTAGDKMRAKVKEGTDALEAKDAKINADWAEDYAYDAVQFALLAVAEADAAVLESIAARARADVLASA